MPDLKAATCLMVVGLLVHPSAVKAQGQFEVQLQTLSWLGRRLPCSDAPADRVAAPSDETGLEMSTWRRPLTACLELARLAG